MTEDNFPPVDKKAQNAINQVGKDERSLKEFQAEMASDIRMLRSFLSSLDAIVHKDGAGVALMMLMSKGFSLIDEVKNDNFLTFSSKLNINTDYQACGTLAEGYFNEGSSKDGLSNSDVYSMYLLLNEMSGAADDPNIDEQTGSLVGSSADTIIDKIFGLKKGQPITNGIIDGTNAFIHHLFNPHLTKTLGMSPFVKQIYNAFDQESNATDSANQMLQTKASVASNSYKSYLGVETKNFTQWSTLVSDINKQSAKGG